MLVLYLAEIVATSYGYERRASGLGRMAGRGWTLETWTQFAEPKPLFRGNPVALVTPLCSISGGSLFFRDQQ